MRIRIRTTLLALAPFLAFAPTSRADPAAGGALYPPGLQPLIHRANTLFGLGQFSDAAKAYSEAIGALSFSYPCPFPQHLANVQFPVRVYTDQSPADYLLYYKRATAYFSLNRNAPALDDFTKVLALTGGTFDHAHLMSAKIHARDGAFDPALAALAAYSAASAKAQADPHARELHADIAAAAAAAAQAAREAHAQLWTACYESATRALRVAPYALPLRATRARCALKAGDVEAAVGDLARLSQLRPSPAPAEHLALFRLAYFFMPAPAGGAQAQNTALNALKACLNLDPDSGVCLPAHREMKALEKGFARAEALAGKQDWRGLLDHLLGKDRAGTAGFLRAFEDALAKHSARAEMAPTPTATTTTSSSSSKSKGAAAAAGEENPAALPVTYSPRLTRLLHLACSAHTALSSPKAHKRGLPYCERLVAQDPDLLGDAELDAGAAGRAEALMAAEEWEEAVRVLEGAWERSRGEDVSAVSVFASISLFLACFFRSCI